MSDASSSELVKKKSTASPSSDPVTGGDDSGEDEHERLQKIERDEQLSAQIAVLAVEIPHKSIKEGIKSTIMYRRAHRKTKAEWNAERVRDFRVCKDEVDIKAKKEAEAEESELQEEVNAVTHEDTAAKFSVNADPNPYLRFYDYSSFTHGMRQINAKNASVGAIRVVDLAGQLIGDERLADVCYGLRRNPLRVLNLTDNALTDRGMQYLSDVLRSLSGLSDLFLSHNDITDAGVEKIFGAKVFPPQLHKIDLSFNGLGPKAAFTLGRMLQGDRTSHLDSLYLGGKKNKKGWGDEFVRILVDFLTRPHARQLKRLSIPNAGLTAEGISAISAYIACGRELEYLNITQNTLQEPVSRRFFRDALRNSKSINEIACRSGGISVAERMTLEEGALARYPLGWSEKINLAYQTAKELNKCHFLGHAIELVITNNWQAVKPTPWFEVEPMDLETLAKLPASEEPLAEQTKEKAGREKDDVVAKESAAPNAVKTAQNPEDDVGKELLNVPFEVLTMKMEISMLAKNALLSIDGTNKFVARLLQQLEEAKLWLSENMSSFKEPTEFKLSVRKVEAWKDAVRIRKDALIVMLEKFTSTSIVKTEAEGKKNKGKKGKRRQKEATKQNWKKQSKGSRLNLEAVLLSIEQLRSTYIELAEALQYLIGICYLLRVRHLDQLRRARQAQAVTLFTSKKAALASMASQKKHDEPVGSESAIPYLRTLGMAGSFTFFMHVNAPLEIERKKKSLLAFEQDKRRAEQIALKESKKAAAKKNNRSHVGPRFQIFAEGSRPGTAAEMDPINDKKEESYEAWERKEEKEKINTGEMELEMKAHVEEEEEGEDDEELSDSEEEEEEEEEEEDNGEEKKGRERTRFLVPKREIQRKYESIFVEDLLKDTDAMKNVVSQMSRANRRHLVRTVEVPLSMPDDKTGKGNVDVSIFIEVEEERSEPLEPLSRIDAIRTRISHEERVRSRRSAHKYLREEAAASM